MKKLLLAVAAFLSIAGISALNAGDTPACKASCDKAAAACPQSPCSNKDRVTSIRWIESVQHDLDTDDCYVVLVGKITEKYKDETYFFTDGTGTIQLDSDIDLPVGKTIVVRGHIDQAFLSVGKLEVEVKSWRYVK